MSRKGLYKFRIVDFGLKDGDSGGNIVQIWARPGADLSIVLLPFLQTQTKYRVVTMWSVWARDCGFGISEEK